MYVKHMQAALIWLCFLAYKLHVLCGTRSDDKSAQSVAVFKEMTVQQQNQLATTGNDQPIIYWIFYCTSIIKSKQHDH